MTVTVGTFNLNNLFSRFNFEADVSTATVAGATVTEQTTFNFSDPAGFRLRKYEGRLVKGKDPAERADECPGAAVVRQVELEIDARGFHDASPQTCGASRRFSPTAGLCVQTRD
jgi:hypothetical protein